MEPASTGWFDLEDPDDRARLAEPKLALQGLRGLVAFHRLDDFDLAEVGSISGRSGGCGGGFARSSLAVDDSESARRRRDFIATFLEMGGGVPAAPPTPGFEGLPGGGGGYAAGSGGMAVGVAGYVIIVGHAADGGNDPGNCTSKRGDDYCENGQAKTPGGNGRGSGGSGPEGEEPEPEADDDDGDPGYDDDHDDPSNEGMDSIPGELDPEAEGRAMASALGFFIPVGKGIQWWQKWRVARAAASTLGRLVDPKTIRFSQSSIGRTFKDGRTVKSMIEGLRSGALKADDVKPIRVYKRDGKEYTLDNRRLFAFQQAGVKIRTVPASADEIASEAWKHTTQNEGASVVVRGGL